MEPVWDNAFRIKVNTAHRLLLTAKQGCLMCQLHETSDHPTQAWGGRRTTSTSCVGFEGYLWDGVRVWGSLMQCLNPFKHYRRFILGHAQLSNRWFVRQGASCTTRYLQEASFPKMPLQRKKPYATIKNTHTQTHTTEKRSGLSLGFVRFQPPVGV